MTIIAHPELDNCWLDYDRPERGKFFARPNMTAEEVAAEWRAAEEAPDEPPPGLVSKDTIWRRATDEEAERMEAALQSQPVRLRRIYEGATYISTADELYGVLEGALVALFGAERAAELLRS